MTIQVDISGQDALEELVALIEGGEELVLLTRDGQPVAVARPPEPPAVEHAPRQRTLGLFAHLGPMDDPDVFFHPDPEFEELAESRDEDEFYRPPTLET